MQLSQVQNVKPKQSTQAATRRDLAKAVEIAREIRTRERFNKLDFYDPYPYQLNFHKTSSEANQRLLMAANRIGRVIAGLLNWPTTQLDYIHLGGKEEDIDSQSSRGLEVSQMKRHATSFNTNYWVPPMTRKPLGPVLYREI